VTIALHGSYYRYNFGDTLLCRLFCGWLQDVAGGETIVVPQADERNRQLIGADKKGLIAANDARGLLLCGGGYFSQPGHTPQRWSLRAFRRHMWLIEAAKRKGIPYSIVGVGAGPLTVPWLRDKVRRIFDGATTVIVRDQESADFLRELGVVAPVVVAMDAAIGITRDSPIFRDQPVPEVLVKARASGKRPLLIHTACHPTTREREIVEHAADWAAEHPEIYPIFCDDSVSRRPVTWPKAVKEARPALNGRSDHLLYDGRPEGHIALIGGVEGVVTTKLHVGIVGSALERPVISIPAHTKTPRFYKQIGLSENCIPQSSDWRTALTQRLDAWAAGVTPNFETMRKVRASFSYPDTVAKFVAELPNR
jgi:polysaccharide pyruvyl transferase WcaK-like protein